MLQIKLRDKGGPSAEGGVGVKASSGGEATTAACPDHLKIADLAVAKRLGSVTSAASFVKTVGRKARPEMGERVHICLQCNFPIAIYGRLSPCDHAFCLDCARSGSTCYFCDERIQKIQTIKVHEGIWICAAPDCFKSFLKKDEFDTHVRSSHGDLIKKNDSEVASASKPTSESTVQAPAKSALLPSSSSQQKDQHEGMQQKLEPPFLGPVPNLVSGTVPYNSNSRGYDKLDARNQFLQENVGLQGTHPQEYGKFQKSQLGVSDKSPITENAIQFNQAPNTEQDSDPDGEQWQGSMLGFPPRPMVGHVNFMGNNYTQPWGVGPTGGFSDHALVGRQNIDAFKNLSMSDSHGRVEVFQGNVKQNEPSYQALYPAANKDREHLSGQNARDPRDVMGMLPPPPGPRPPHSSQVNRSHSSAGGAGHGAQAPW
ncbi:E3 ubiquitin-protein ligase HAKAI homolog isoform X1 [Apium graveolens]|uniref:E3 ubiquitin-protein ligase HAKAI homolog isoform X1 n=1 Tax=Apium graveolens TaxID=4045 RepID=UPI003D79ED6B